jgi:hypothetical protein
VSDWLSVLFAGVITGLGWFASYYFAKLKEDRTKRLELQMEHLHRQIEDFYGPLYNLINEIAVSKKVLDAIVEGDSVPKLSADAIVQVKVFIRENQMKPLHDQIIAILHSKLYLVDGINVPPSFREYLHHAIQGRLQREIWTQLQISTIHVRGRPFPDEFRQDVHRGLLAVMKRYEDTVAELAPRRQSLRPSAPLACEHVSTQLTGADRSDQKEFDAERRTATTAPNPAPAADG